VLAIPQLTAPGTIEELPLLPSFLYLPHADELAPGENNLPWQQSAEEQTGVAGEMARSRGATTPIRLVSSAKSWLSHPGVDRRSALLPNDAPEEVARVSPLEASTRYLSHLRKAWEQAHPEAPFGEQAVTVTIPASFDPGARELTADAARAPATPISRCWKNRRPPVQLDPGQRRPLAQGSQTGRHHPGGRRGRRHQRLSLIAVLERDGVLEPHRIAVGDHILLGGDNMDLALAHLVARKLAANGTQLDAWQMRALTYGCRTAKEKLLADETVATWPIVVPSRGSKLIGGSIRTELTREEVSTFILDGFFPQVEASARPAVRHARGPDAAWPAVCAGRGHHAPSGGVPRRQVGATAELEGYAGKQSADATFLHPTAVLFNGGVFKSDLLAQRIMGTINDWLYMEGAEPARMLGGADLDLAVARGAAYYSYVRRGSGVRIRGGTARSYYVAIESAMPAIPGMEPPIQALCVAPFGMEEGSEIELPNQEFGLVVGEPVQFRFFGSSVRRQDQIGDLLDFWGPDELIEMNEIQANLSPEGRQAGDVVQVRLHAMATESGTLELAAVANDGQRWKVEFDVRSACMSNTSSASTWAPPTR
jgi:hypothetical protein